MGRPAGSESNYQPTEGWRFEVIIGEYDYSDDAVAVRIGSALSGVYPVFTITLLLNPTDILFQNIYGHLPIKMRIMQFGHGTPGSIDIKQQLKLDLMYLSSDFDIPISAEIIQGAAESNKDLIPMGIIAVPSIAFRAMTNYVNKTYFDMAPWEIIADLITDLENIDGVDTPEFDRTSPNLNEDLIPQIIIPPTTIYNNIKYVDNTFGVYKGMTEMFCYLGSSSFRDDSQSTSIVFACMDLSYRMQSNTINPIFTVTQLANTGDNPQIIQADENGTKLFTYHPVHSEYMANSIYAVDANNVFYIGKPTNKLFNRTEYNLQYFAETNGYGLIDGNDKQVFVNDILRNRKRIDIDTMGYQPEFNSEFNTSNHYAEMIRKIATLTRLTITMEKDTPIQQLLNIGRPVKFESNTVDYVKLIGKYILYASDIQWEKRSEWQMFSTIKLVRTNRHRTA